MSSLPLLLFPSILLSMPGAVSAEGEGTKAAADRNNPFSENHSDSQVTIRTPSLSNLPSSVTHATNSEGQHVFTILGIADVPAYIKEEFEKGVFAQRPLDNFKPTIPGIVDLDIHHEERKATLTISRQPSIAELIAGIDETAKVRYDFPSWSELEARDIGKAAAYSDASYTVGKPDAPSPTGFAWYHILPMGTFSFSAPFSVDGGPIPGSILIHSAPVPIGSPRQHTIRILDAGGKLIWSRILPVPHGRFAITDTNDDGAHELQLTWSEKKDAPESRLQISPK
ncbi:MAG: hypothetical protein EOP88_10330 [Verrucomicrobiaceae bacterium]|nr:MAG: hypothetical protein EOP88_10330 [Verrucomicrobiaceae bacterium]